FEPSAWRAAHGLARAREVIGYLGFVNQSKGVGDLVEGLGALVDGGRDTYLVMIGEQLGTSDVTNRAYRDEIRHQIVQRGLQDRIVWTGHLQLAEIAAWLRSVDLVALPFVDGASLRRTSLIAAWGNGAPVVTTLPHESAAWLGDLAPAIFVRPGDSTALATAMEDMLEHADRRTALRDGGLCMAKRFAWPAVTRDTVAVYAASIERARR
ncbi:MAG TPA: glycosyltransferase, partial [Chloroflexota bacterium]|nr:glycosyltransferase [Chloroflexota bacterium]